MMSLKSTKQPKRGRLPNAALNLLLVGVSLLIALGILEVFLRVLDPNGAFFKIRQTRIGPKIYQEDPYQHHVFRPGIDLVFKSREYAARVRTNALGLRDYDVETFQDPQEEKILFLGDSYIAGLRNELEDTVTKQLESFMNQARSSRIRVINAGASSYSPVLEYLQLKKLFPLFHPEVVILALFINDFGGDYELINSPGARFDESGLVVSIEGPESPMPGFFYRHFYLYHFFSGATRTLKASLAQFLVTRGLEEFFRPYYNVDRWDKSEAGPDRLQDSLKNQEYLDATWTYIRAIRNYCEKRGATFLLVIIPQPNQIGKGQVRPGWQCIWYSPVAYIESTLYQDLVEAFCLREDMHCVDLLPSFRKAHDEGLRLHYRRDGHWNPQGHELAARVINDYIVEQGLLPSH